MNFQKAYPEEGKFILYANPAASSNVATMNETPPPIKLFVAALLSSEGESPVCASKTVSSTAHLVHALSPPKHTGTPSLVKHFPYSIVLGHLLMTRVHALLHTPRGTPSLHAGQLIDPVSTATASIQSHPSSTNFCQQTAFLPPYWFQNSFCAQTLAWIRLEARLDRVVCHENQIVFNGVVHTLELTECSTDDQREEEEEEDR